jgi:autotransporter-associated beta strand protein
VATITYFSDAGGAVTLDLDDDDGIGSTILSGFDGTNTSSKLTGGDDGVILTINAAAGHTGDDAFEFSGDIYESSSASTDLSIIKTGAGDQKLTGKINLASGSGDKGYINLAAGGLTLNPASGETQIIEYLKGSGTLILDNTGRSDQTLELGFAQSHATSEATFTGAVTLQGDNTKNTIKVATGTTAADYSKEQVMSGIISGGEVLVKDGVGRLTLEGNNANTGGVEINNGTLAVGNVPDNADLGSGTVTINKGKLEVLTDDALSNTINGGTDATKKSMIGGDGTVSSITIGSGSGEIDVLSPGRGISTSLTETSGLTKNQLGYDNNNIGDAIGSFTATTLSLQGGGVFDWEIKDFNGNTAGTDYDVLNFGTLNLGAKNETFTINILGLDSNGAPGAPANFGIKSSPGANGYTFLSGTTVNWTGGTEWTSAELNDYFVFNTDDLDFRTNNWEKSWEVYYNSGDFYLQFTATPEPSTYIMVAGLFMLPGYRMIKRMRKKFSSTSIDTEDDA